MATYRCKACSGLYVSPQGGTPYFHVCPPERNPVTGEERPYPGHRDETMVQVPPGQDAPPIPPGRAVLYGTVTRRAWGAGRIRLAEADLVSGATAERLAELRGMAGTDEGTPPD